MEDVLAVYTRPHNADYPLVCLDETSKQLIAETRTPIPMKRGRAARVDYEYERNGTANLFMLFAPLEGWRHVEVTDRHTAVDYAHVLKDLADRHFPHAKTIVLVKDNLRPPKPDGWSSASNGTTRLSTAVGSISRNPNSVSSPLSVSIAASQTNRPSSRKSPRGNTTEMPITQRQTGNSQPNPLESNSTTYTLRSS